MSSQAIQPMKRFPLHERHAEKGARFGQFGEWEVPLYYTSILEEHEAVRTRAAVFDISHMGEFVLSGTDAEGFLEAFLPRKVALMPIGKALYMPLLNEDGGMADDIIVYRTGSERFLIIVNAGNVDKDFAYISTVYRNHFAQEFPQVSLENVSEGTGLLALQGPLSAEILDKALGEKFSDLKYYHCRGWRNGLVARTGYTGEDGFEIMVPYTDLDDLWNALFEAGSALGMVAAGFGARDTLRLEAGMPLYGHDMNEKRTPFEAGIGWSVQLDKPRFAGKTALLDKQKKTGGEKLIAFEMIDRGIPREDYPVHQSGSVAGRVTSGSFSPTLKKNIGLAYFSGQKSEPGEEIEIMIRNKPAKAKIVALPFYKRQKKT